MATYSFIVKKGKFQLTLTTEDREFISEQFESWVRHADKYVKNKKKNLHLDSVNEQIKKEEEITRKKIEEQVNRGQKPIEADLDEAEQAVNCKNDTQDKELDIFYAPENKESVKAVPVQQKEASSGVFDDILEHSINTPQEELNVKVSPSIKRDNAYINYMGSRKIDKKIDYLLLTAYYFAQYEQKPRFTLKQLNAKLMQNLAVIVDHAVVQEAINRDYIECLPDLTGVIGASEYRLTAYGEKILLDN